MARVYAGPPPRELPPPELRYEGSGGGRLPGATTIIDDLGLRHDYSAVAPEVLAAAAARGTRVHAAAAALLLGEKDPRSDLEPGDRAYFVAFEAWLELVEVVPILVEHQVVVEDGPYPYGMRIDLFARVFGRPTVLDIKCRPSIDGDGLQTWAYLHGLRWSGVGAALGARRCCLELRKNSRFKVHPHEDDPGDALRFERARAEWYARHGRLVQGGGAGTR